MKRPLWVIAALVLLLLGVVSAGLYQLDRRQARMEWRARHEDRIQRISQLRADKEIGKLKPPFDAMLARLEKEEADDVSP